MGAPNAPNPASDDRVREWLERRREMAVNRRIPLADRAAPTLASFGQQRLWLAAQSDPDGQCGTVTLSWTIIGKLDVPALFGAVNLIVERHESLRTGFAVIAGELYQIVREPFGFPAIPVVVPGADTAAREQSLRQLLDELSQHTFDPDSGHLIHVTLLKLGAREHVLVINVAHIAFDEASLNVMIRELAAAYDARCQGTDDGLRPLPIQYRDFARWQREQLSAAGALQEIALRAEQLNSAPRVPGLPPDMPAGGPLGGATLGFMIDDVARRDVESLAQQERTTPFTVLAAAFCVLLAKATGSRQVGFATPVSNRTRQEFEPLIGFFVNTLAMHVAIDRAASFRALLRSMREQVLDAMDFAHIPLEFLAGHDAALVSPKAAMNLPRVAITFHQGADLRLELPDLTVEVLESPGNAIEYDLVLTLEQGSDGLLGTLFYQPALFHRETIDRLSAEYVRIVAAVVERPDAPLTASWQAHDQLSGWPDPAGADGVAQQSARPNLVVERVHAHAGQNPDRLAVIAGAGSLTYADLDLMSDRLAARLAEAGVGPEQQVGVALERSCSQVVALLAIWKAGAAFVPLDLAHPADRLGRIARSAGLRCLIASEAPPWWTGPVMNSAVSGESGVATTRWTPRRVHHQSAAYVIYTSGTSGEPKGVTATHGGLANLVLALDELAGDAEGTFANVLSVSFDGWIWSTIFPLAQGRGVVLGDFDDGLEQFLRTYDVVGVTVTPSMLATCQALPPSLTTLVVAGEQCAQGLARQWSSGRRFINAYGPTEATICASWADSVAGDDVTCLGRPIAGFTLHVVDSLLRPVPPGVTGELVIRGPGVARGYRGRPGLTAARFAADPFGGRGQRIYRTGDLACRSADGSLRFVGRADHQVKVRGFRVELEEVDSCAAEIDGVRQAAAYLTDAANGGAVGLAVVAATADAGLAEHVRQQLALRLPRHAVPIRVSMVSSLPLNPAGKLDRACLAEMVSADALPLADRQPDWVVDLVSRIWSDVLGAPVPDVSRNFFDLGGHSLSAAQVVAAVRKETGARLTVRDLMNDATIAGFSARVRNALGG
jgi:amino acid adenylation domain-containing protein